jgi:hypothetical protein
MSLEKDVYGATHPENAYNLENEDRDRALQAREGEIAKGRQPFVSIENVPDEDAEDAIYARAQAGLDREAKKADQDKFGFASMVTDFFSKVSADKKEEFLGKSVLFLEEYRRILASGLGSKEAREASQKAFDTIIGRQILSHDVESGKHDFSLEKAEYINVTEKSAPADAYHSQYDNKGRVIDPEKPVKEKVKKTKSSFLKTAFKLPWR